MASRTRKRNIDTTFTNAIEENPTRKKSRLQKKTNPKSVPFAKGFRPATSEEVTHAVGDSLPKTICSLLKSNIFAPIPQPVSVDDWLAQYKEEGQSFDQFIDENPWLSPRKIKYYRGLYHGKGKDFKKRYCNGKIYLQPIGTFNDKDFPQLEELVIYARIFLSVDVILLPRIEVIYPTSKNETVSFIYTNECKEKEGFEKKKCNARQKRINFRMAENKIQLQVNSIHSYLKLIMPDDALCTIGLTMADLFEDKPDLFVAGMANGSQRVAVFSFARYDPTLTFSKEFWYIIKETRKIPAEEKRKLLLQRSCKLLVHEIMHLLGIDHCIWYDCCMNGSGHLEEDFRQPMFLCPVDLRKLQHLTRFDILDRYKEMNLFFEKHNLQKDVEWLQSAIECIGSS